MCIIKTNALQNRNSRPEIIFCYLFFISYRIRLSVQISRFYLVLFLLRRGEIRFWSRQESEGW